MPQTCCQSSNAAAVAKLREKNAVDAGRFMTLEAVRASSMVEASGLLYKVKATVADEAIDEALSLMSDGCSAESLAQAHVKLNSFRAEPAVDRARQTRASHALRDALVDTLLASIENPGDGQAAQILESCLKLGLDRSQLYQAFNIKLRFWKDIGTFLVSLCDDLSKSAPRNKPRQSRPRRPRSGDEAEALVEADNRVAGSQEVSMQVPQALATHEVAEDSHGNCAASGSEPVTRDDCADNQWYGSRIDEDAGADCDALSHHAGSHWYSIRLDKDAAVDPSLDGITEAGVDYGYYRSSRGTGANADYYGGSHWQENNWSQSQLKIRNTFIEFKAPSTTGFDRMSAPSELQRPPGLCPWNSAPFVESKLDELLGDAWNELSRHIIALEESNSVRARFALIQAMPKWHSLADSARENSEEVRTVWISNVESSWSMGWRESVQAYQRRAFLFSIVVGIEPLLHNILARSANEALSFAVYGAMKQHYELCGLPDETAQTVVSFMLTNKPNHEYDAHCHGALISLLGGILSGAPPWATSAEHNKDAKQSVLDASVGRIIEIAGWWHRNHFHEQREAELLRHALAALESIFEDPSEFRSFGEDVSLLVHWVIHDYHCLDSSLKSARNLQNLFFRWRSR